jgi:transcription antitermination factor NusG
MLTNIFKWYALYTRPRWEKKVAESLTRKKIENYCPLNKVLHQWSDRKKIVLEPLFTSYVFVYISAAEQLAVRQTEGVTNFVYWLKKPAIIRTEEIEIIKKFLNDHINVRLEKIEVNTNDIVRIVSGPLMLREGKVVEIMNRAVKVLLPSLGYSLIAQVDKVNIEKVENLLPKAVDF